MFNFQALFLGFLQGATEFLPVSSSGHLFLAENFLSIEPDLHFMISAHLASLLAVILVYRKRTWSLTKSLFLYFHNKNEHHEEATIALQLILATIMTVGVALLIEPYFDVILTLQVVAVTLIITGILILVAEVLARRNIHKKFTWPLALVLGLVQGLAVIPGISRSGLTIAFLIGAGVERKQSADISFLLSIPTILGAGIFLLKKNGWNVPLDTATFWGCVASFFTALLVIYWMKKLIEKHWIWFSPYCIGLGSFILIWFYAF